MGICTITALNRSLYLLHLSDNTYNYVLDTILTVLLTLIHVSLKQPYGTGAIIIIIITILQTRKMHYREVM